MANLSAKIRIHKLQLKTPLWTGDIDTKSDLIQATGIIGSLRWWSEAILRSMDKYICDPTSDNRCPKEDGNKKNYCLACLVFGATGMRRTFRLKIDGGKRVFDGGAINIKPKGRKGGWYLGSGLNGEIKLSIVPLSKDFDENLVLVPLTIAANWGGIGAKTQHGYGVVEIEDSSKPTLDKFKGIIEKITNQERLSKLNIVLRNDNNSGLPDIKDMFFAKVRFEADNNEWWKEVDGIAKKDKKDQKNYYRGCVNDPRMIDWIESGSVPITPAIKNWLRYGDGKQLWQTKNQNIEIETWLFGTIERVCAICYGKVSKDRNNPQNFSCKNCKKSFRKEEIFEGIASKINVSCAYPVKNNLWEFRIWGWIPGDGMTAGFNRDNFLDALKQALDGGESIKIPWEEILGNKTKNHKLIVWREYESSRDTVKQNETDIGNYLQSLINCEEAGIK